MSLCVEVLISIPLLAKIFCWMCRWTSSAEGRFSHKQLLYLFVAFVCLFDCLSELRDAGGSVNPPAEERLAGRAASSFLTNYCCFCLFICCICLFACLSELKDVPVQVEVLTLLQERDSRAAASSFLTLCPQSTSAPIAVRCFVLSLSIFPVFHDIRSRSFQN